LIKKIILILFFWEAMLFCPPISALSDFRDEQKKEEQVQIPDLIKAIISVESSWVTNAVSHKGAVGLMQVTQDGLDEYNRIHASDYLIGDLFNPEINLMIGKSLIYDRKIPMCGGDLICALNVYNMGWGNARKGKTNWSYISKVLSEIGRIGGE